MTEPSRCSLATSTGTPSGPSTSRLARTTASSPAVRDMGQPTYFETRRAVGRLQHRGPDFGTEAHVDDHGQQQPTHPLALGYEIERTETRHGRYAAHVGVRERWPDGNRATNWHRRDADRLGGAAGSVDVLGRGQARSAENHAGRGRGAANLAAAAASQIPRAGRGCVHARAANGEPGNRRGDSLGRNSASRAITLCASS